MKKSIFLFLLAFMSLTASAQDPVKVGDYWYIVENNHFTATLVANPEGEGYSGDVVINGTIEYGGNTYRVSEIGYRAFCGTDILKVTINGQLNDKGSGLRVGIHAFSYCKSLLSVEIGDGVDYIQGYAFYACDNLANVVLGNDVFEICYHAFQNCPSLASITLGKGLNWIDSSVFFGCGKLKDVYCYGEKSPSQDWGLIFEESQLKNMTLHVPEAYYSNYIFDNGKDNYPWQHFGKTEKIQNTTLEKCKTPTINYANGTVSFACDTEGVEYNSTVEYVNNSFVNASNFPAPSKFRVKVVAVKGGYKPSDVAEAVFDLPSYVGVNKTGNYKEGDVNKDGKVDVADHVKLANAMK